MTKCTYPKCTDCLDNCPQDAIDFSVDPPVFRNWCESGDSVCFDVCPENAIEYLTSAETNWWSRGRRRAAQAEASTTGEEGEAAQPVERTRSLPPKFRPLIREEDIGARGPITDFTTYPRLLINKELWPYDIHEG